MIIVDLDNVQPLQNEMSLTFGAMIKWTEECKDQRVLGRQSRVRSPFNFTSMLIIIFFSTRVFNDNVT